MSAVQRGTSAAAASARGRSFRPAWSLAAGTGLRVRVSWFAVASAVVLSLNEVPWLARNPDGSIGVHRPFAPVVVATLATWIAWSVGARPWRRRAGERRQRERGGERWWLDRDWPSSGVERRIAPGIRGPSVLVTSVVIATLAFCALALSYLGSISPLSWNPTAAGSPEEWGWVPAPAGVVVAAWTTPFLWWILVAGPRLGRGQFVVSWPSLPQRTGGRCAFHVATSPGSTRIDSVRVFLRCIRTRHRTFLPLAAWNARLVWAREARLRLGAYVGPESHLVAEFDVPADAPPTDLHAKDAVRWEVLVLGTVAGTEYADSVLVPVYAA